jgi:hypothetical protein
LCDFVGFALSPCFSFSISPESKPFQQVPRAVNLRETAPALFERDEYLDATMDETADSQDQDSFFDD